MARVEIERQISFFSFGFARVSEVRHLIFKLPWSSSKFEVFVKLKSLLFLN